MRYITDIHAMNLPCSLRTTGDWHTSAIQWKNPRMMESDGSLLGDWGIEKDSPVAVPEHQGKTFNIANHLRAACDMLAAGRFTVAEGLNGDFIDIEDYEPELFEHVLMLRPLPNWSEIDQFMKREYLLKWKRFIESRGES